MSAIGELAAEVLTEEELLLSIHLERILVGKKLDSERFLNRILPRWWEEIGEHVRSLLPEGIYRPLYYVVGYGRRPDFRRVTRTFIQNVSAHFEGAIHQLRVVSVGKRGPKSTRGEIERLRNDRVFTEELAGGLHRFNEVVNIQSKHFDAMLSPRWLNLRTFSTLDASRAFVLMRHFSIRLFGLIQQNGGSLPYVWPDFDPYWLDWQPSIYERGPTPTPNFSDSEPIAGCHPSLFTTDED